MKSLILAFTLVFSLSFSVSGQKYFTKTGSVSFYSSSPMEKIEGVSKSANCVMDLSSGVVEFAVLVKSLNFEKALMQEHFNENYMESTKFPKAIFKGMISNIAEVKLNTSGSYVGMVKGNITIHGITKPLETTVTFKSDGVKSVAVSEFNLTVVDFNISIPSLVKDNIAKTVKVTVKADLEEFKKAQ